MTVISIKGVITSEEFAWFYDWFGEPYTTAERFKVQLDAADDDVIVEVNSPGGMVTAGAEIYEAIRGYSGNIECHVVGQAASAASIIVCAAKSSISPMGFLFLHNCLGSVNGNHNDMREAAQMLESIDENIMGAYREKTGMTDTQIYRLMERNTTLSATKAVELGFIDRISGDDAGNASDNVTTNQGAVRGIAAAAPGYLDPMAIDAERLSALRNLYEQSKRGNAGGGDPMNIEDIKETDEVDDEPENNDVDEIDADADGEAGTDVEPENDATEGGTDADETDEGEAEADDDAEGEIEDDGEAEPEADSAEGVSDYDAGVLAERERISGILAIAHNVPDGMVTAALFENPISAEQLALNAMMADGAAREGYMSKARADAKASGSSEVAAAVADDDDAATARNLAAKVNERFGK